MYAGIVSMKLRLSPWTCSELKYVIEGLWSPQKTLLLL